MGNAFCLLSQCLSVTTLNYVDTDFSRRQILDVGRTSRRLVVEYARHANSRLLAPHIGAGQHSLPARMRVSPQQRLSGVYHYKMR